MQRLASNLDLRQTLLGFLNEDVGTGDITSQSIVPADQNSSAVIICKIAKNQRAVLSGLQEAQMIFEICGCNCTTKFAEGSTVRNKDIILEVVGNSRSILKAERTALNLVMRMSGI